MRVTFLVGLPVLVLAGWCAVAAARLGWRDGVLLGFMLWLSGWLVGAAALSAVEQFNRGGVLVVQVLQLVVIAVVLSRRRPEAPRLQAGWRDLWVVVLAVEALVLLVLAVSVAPTNWDSMSYHLVKVAQWSQAEQVGSFPTEFAPQVYLPFLAEIGMAQFLLLTDSLWTTNLVQYAAHLVGLVAVSVLARNVGVERRGQAIAAGVFGLSPMVVSQAVTTQNDYVMCTLVIITYAMATRRPAGPWCLVLVALASGLAVAVKPSAVLMLWPALVWSLRHLRGVDPRRLALPLVASIVIGLGANVWWMAINQQSWGQVTGVESKHTNLEISVDTVVSNLVRNFTNQVALPSVEANDKIEAGVRDVLTGMGIDPDDPDTSLEPYVVESFRSEDRSSHPLQVALILVAAGALALAGRRGRRLWPVAAAMVVVVVTAAVVLRWQSFNGRFLLTAVALGAVLVGAAWSRWPRWVGTVTLAALTAASLPYLLNQTGRPLIGESSVLTTGPEEELFRWMPGLREPYQGVADSLRGQDAPRLGLENGMWIFEFPMWWVVKQANPSVVIGSSSPCPETVPPGAAEPDWDLVVNWTEISGQAYWVAPGTCAH